MKSRIVTIARYTVLEALRTRLPLFAALIVAVLVAGSFFIREIAITDSVRFQVGFYAAAARFAAMFVAALYVIAAVAREFQDKGIDVALALDLPRSHYIVGKLVGFVVIATVIAIAIALPLTAFANAGAVLQWTISLAAELAIVVALSLFCVVTFNQLMPAASFVVAFYLLARALTAIRLIGANPIADAGSAAHQVMRWLVEGLALVMPPLDAWTQTAWLVDRTSDWQSLAAIAAQCALFLLILSAAAIFDLQRRNF